MASKSKPVGIDLGTTYSAMACIDETGQSQIVINGEGDMLTPSVVLFEDDEVIVGKEAKKVTVLKTDRIATCVKRDMGKPVYSKPINGRYLPPEVIQSYILKKIKKDISSKVGPDFNAIITVPAFFDEPRRKATYDAGQMAGIKVLDIVNEPTAAALAFGERLGYLTRFGAPKERINVIVYDLGGGTFDVTLIDMQAGDLRTVCTDGDVQLGGHDWDMRLVDYLSEEFMKEHSDDPRKSPESFQRLLSDAEQTKHTLSARTQTKVRVDHNGKSSVIPVTRDVFEMRTADLLERTRYTTRNLLKTAGLEWKNIGRILLTGGSTRMPMVSNMLKELSEGLEPDHGVNPDEAVARGAAIYAGYLLAAKGESGHEPTFDVTNVNAHSLGIEGYDPQTMRRRNSILIPRNTALPAKHTEVCMTKEPNQKTVVIQVLEGESSNPDECTSIGRTVIRNLPPNLPQGWPVEVTYEYGVNGRLSVRASVKDTDREVKLELERDESMSDSRITQWRKVIAGGGGLDTFDLAVQAELDQLRGRAAQAGLPAFASTGVPHPQSGLATPSYGQPMPGQSGIGQPGSQSGIGQAAPPQPGVPTASPAQSGIGQAPPPGVPTASPAQSGIGQTSPAAPVQPGQPPQPIPTGGMPPGGQPAPPVPATPVAAPAQAPMPGVPGGSGIATAAPPGSAVGAPTSGQPAAAVATAATATQPQQAGGSQPQQKKKGGSGSGLDLVLYIFLSALAVMVIYYVAVWLFPGANVLRLNLPGLPPVDSGEETSLTPEVLQPRALPIAHASCRVKALRPGPSRAASGDIPWPEGRQADPPEPQSLPPWSCRV